MLNTQIPLETEALQERLKALLSPEVAKIVEDLTILYMLNSVADYAPLPDRGLKMQARLFRKIKKEIDQLEAATTAISIEPIPVSVEVPAG